MDVYCVPVMRDSHTLTLVERSRYTKRCCADLYGQDVCCDVAIVCLARGWCFSAEGGNKLHWMVIVHLGDDLFIL